MDRRSFFFTLLAVPIAAAVASAQQPARGGFVPDTRYLVGETPCETILPAGLVKRMEDEFRRHTLQPWIENHYKHPHISTAEIARIFDVPVELVEL